MTNFTASRGWFFRFKQRTGIHNVRIVGESASADKEAALRYPKELSEIIQKVATKMNKYSTLMKQDYSGKRCRHALL